jgi:ubiquinone/menaquinone biosynthesis C-methylase UbiE
MSSELPTNSQPSDAAEPTWTAVDTVDLWQRAAGRRDEVYTQATEQLLDLARVGRESRVLDIAAGTGGQTLQAARRAGPRGRVLATDISAAMLEVTAEAAREAGFTTVETRVMDAQRLDLGDETFDAVICKNGLMLFPDPPQALAEMCRVARRGGYVAALVFAGEERNPYHGIPQSVARRIGSLPEPSPGTPWQFCLGDPQRLSNLFRAAGLRDVDVHRAPIRRRFASTAAALHSTQTESPHTRELMSRLTETQREQAWQETERELRRFEGPNGCELPGESLIAVGTK